MTRDPFSDGPELVPPAELLRLRDRLRGDPSASTRAHHLTRAAAVAREHPIVHPLSRFASRGVRIAVAAVASIVITSGLAGAQLLPDPAQRLLSNVSERFAPEAPAATTTEAPSDPPARHDGSGGGGLVPAIADPTSTTAGGASGPATTVAPVTVTSTTLPGPTGPGSPTDPTDPGPTDPSTTTSSTTSTTVDPSSTTTTTDPSTTTTTDPGTSTTTTSVAPSP